MRADELEKRLKEKMPAAAYIRWKEHKGVALSLGENLTELWQSGDVIVFWDDGDHTVLHDPGGNGIHADTEIEVIERLFGLGSK